MESKLAQPARTAGPGARDGGVEGLRRHRESGRLPVRERLALLIDPESWFEIGALGLPELRSSRHVPGDAVVTGFARLDGRRIGVIGIDSSVLAGTTAPTSMRKQGRLIEMSQRFGFPLVLLCDADGGRIPDVMGWRFSHLPLDFKTFIKCPEGQPPVPRAAAILGPSYGDSALHAVNGSLRRHDSHRLGRIVGTFSRVIRHRRASDRSTVGRPGSRNCRGQRAHGGRR